MGPKKTLLIIFSNQILIDLIRKILERVGYNVCCAAGLNAAREILVELIPDGIVVENELPDGTGIEFCHGLRETSDIPVMLLSGNKDLELHALLSGANDFLKKPVDYDILKARISIMLNMSGISPSRSLHT